MSYSTTQICHRKLTYFELLLCDTAVVWVQELEYMGNQISAAEIVGSQCSEQHNLSFAANLEVNKSLSDGIIYLRCSIIDSWRSSVSSSSKNKKN